MEIQGRIIKKFPLRSGVSASSGKDWKVQEYVLETHDQYPRKVFFGFFGEASDKYILQEGDEATVSFDIESRSFVGRDGVERWSTDIRAWKAVLDNQQQAYTAAPNPAPSQPYEGFPL